MLHSNLNSHIERNVMEFELDLDSYEKMYNERLLDITNEEGKTVKRKIKKIIFDNKEIMRNSYPHDKEEYDRVWEYIDDYTEEYIKQAADIAVDELNKDETVYKVEVISQFGKSPRGTIETSVYRDKLISTGVGKPRVKSPEIETRIKPVEFNNKNLHKEYRNKILKEKIEVLTTSEELVKEKEKKESDK
jgi:hypothetical protein